MYVTKTNTILKKVAAYFAIISICVFITVLLSIYYLTSGKTKYSREYLLRKEYPNAVIGTELIFDQNIAHGFLTANNEFGIAVFKQTEYKTFKLADHTVSTDNDTLIIETTLDGREYYVFAIDNEKLQSATLNFLFDNDTCAGYEDLRISGREMFVLIKPQRAHEIIVTCKEKQ